MPPETTGRLTPRALAALALLPILGLAGCAGEKAAAPAPKPPTVVVAQPIEREVADFEDFVGQTMAVYTIDVRARVTGYLDKVNFEDGSEVAKDALLFEIDPRPYEAEVARTKASLDQAIAHHKRLEADYHRAQALVARGQLAPADYDLTTGDYSEASAMVGIAEAQAKLARLNLNFTQVTAPIAGRLSRRLVDPGNLISADNTILTSIVSLDPMYVYFDIDERTLLKIRRLVAEGKVKSRQEGAELPIYGALADETGFPHRGLINFSDNRLDTNTGTLRVRAVLPNPKPRVFSPGLFMKVHLPVGNPHRSILVPEEAVGTDQGEKYVYLVDDKNAVVQRRIVAGNLYFQGWRAVEKGVAMGDRIIVSGLQRVRPGAKVEARAGKPQVAAPPEGSPGEVAASGPSAGSGAVASAAPASEVVPPSPVPAGATPAPAPPVGPSIANPPAPPGRGGEPKANNAPGL